MPRTRLRSLVAAIAFTLPMAAGAPAQAAVPDLEKTSASQLAELMADGELTSYELTRAYIDRIAAVNQRGPAINAVRSLNPKALDEAKASDAARRAGSTRPLEGLPILLKDNIDVAGTPTTVSSIALEHSVPDEDAFVVKRLKAAGAVILGKVNLTEFAAFVSGQQQSGNGSLSGQVLNPYDRTFDPSGSSSGSASAMAAGLAAMTVGSDTEGSIVYPAANQGIVGLRPSTGLISRGGVVPISSSQDTLGPMTLTVTDLAMMLDTVVGVDPEDPHTAETAAVEGTKYTDQLQADALQGARIGVNSGTTTAHYVAAVDKLRDAGATIVPIPNSAFSFTRGGDIQFREFRRDLTSYLSKLPASAPLKSFDEVFDYLRFHPEEGLKYGITRMQPSSTFHLENPAEQAEYEQVRDFEIARSRTFLNGLLDSNDLDAVIVTNNTLTTPAAYAGFPVLTLPSGYATDTARPTGVQLVGRRFSEAELVGYGYAYERTIPARKAPSELNPADWRCVPGPRSDPHACAPTGAFGPLTNALIPPPLDLETLGVDELQRRLRAGTVTSTQLVKAYLDRIGFVNRQGPGLNVVRAINPAVMAEAAAAGGNGPLAGVPVLVDDTVNVKGMPTTGGALALEHLVASEDAAIVTKLRAAGAIILGKANVTELKGMVASGMPTGYGSLSGQTMNPYDGRSTATGVSAGATGAVATGLAAVAIGNDTTAGGLLTAAAATGVVAIRPTAGLVSRTGVLPTALSQDTPGATGRTVADVASTLSALAEPATDYRAALSKDALDGKRIAVVTNNEAAYTEAVATLTELGAEVVTVAAPSTTAPPQIVDREFKRDFNAFLAGFDGPVKTLADVLAFNDAHPVDTKKFTQARLEAANAVDLGDPATAAQYESDRSGGRTAARSALDARLAGVDAIFSMVASTATQAARAGYPVVTVPVGYTTNNRRPVAAAFTGAAGDDADLLAFAYAYERGAQIRQTPSQINPQTWHCVAPVVYGPRTCGPGEPTEDEVVPTPEATPTPAPPVATPAPKPLTASSKPATLTIQARRAGARVSGEVRGSALPATAASVRISVYDGDTRIARRSAKVVSGAVRLRFSGRVRSRTVTVTVTRLSPRGYVQKGGATRRLKIGKPLAAGKRSKLVTTTIR